MVLALVTGAVINLQALLAGIYLSTIVLPMILLVEGTTSTIAVELLSEIKVRLLSVYKLPALTDNTFFTATTDFNARP